MNMEVQFRYVPVTEIKTIVPLLAELNPSVSTEKLDERLREMYTQNYKCAGVYHMNELIGICGLWFCTRHYCGRSVEPDHVYIKKEFQGMQIGERLFAWLTKELKNDGWEAIELNTYVQNTRSHKFYYNLGFEILGYHFLKVLK